LQEYVGSKSDRGVTRPAKSCFRPDIPIGTASGSVQEIIRQIVAARKLARHRVDVSSWERTV
jgi:hypothetical protein